MLRAAQRDILEIARIATQSHRGEDEGGGLIVLNVLNGLILTNKKILLSDLFKAVGETLVDFGRTRLGGQIGLITVLHTWDQTLLDHFHPIVCSPLGLCRSIKSAGVLPVKTFCSRLKP